MPPKKRARTDGTVTLEAQGSVVTKKKMAKRLLNGDGVDKDEAKAVLILEDCVAHGDAVAMLMLAQCCAHGRGMEHNVERAEALLFKAADKGNCDAQVMSQKISSWKKQKRIQVSGV